MSISGVTRLWPLACWNWDARRCTSLVIVVVVVIAVLRYSVNSKTFNHLAHSSLTQSLLSTGDMFADARRSSSSSSSSDDDERRASACIPISACQRSQSRHTGYWHYITTSKAWKRKCYGLRWSNKGREDKQSQIHFQQWKIKYF